MALNAQDPATHRETRRSILLASAWPSSKSPLADIWGRNEQMEDSPLSLSSLCHFVFRVDENK